MDKFKIIKEAHTYGANKTLYVVHKKKFIGWTPAKFDSTHFKYQYDSFFEAEMSIFDYFKTKHGGITSIDVNIYTYAPFSLSIP